MMDDWSSLQALLWYNETKIVHSGTYSIKFQATAGNNFYLQCWGCINTTLVCYFRRGETENYQIAKTNAKIKHQGIEFWINRGNTIGQDVQFVLMDIPDLAAIGTPEAVSLEAIVFNLTVLLDDTEIANQWQRVLTFLSN
jgi:hypothetical protein